MNCILCILLHTIMFWNVIFLLTFSLTATKLEIILYMRKTWQANCVSSGLLCPRCVAANQNVSFSLPVSQIYLPVPSFHWSICHLFTTSSHLSSFHLVALREVRMMVLICVYACACPLSVPYWLRHCRPTHTAVSTAATHTHITDDKISGGPNKMVYAHRECDKRQGELRKRREVNIHVALCSSLRCCQE